MTMPAGMAAPTCPNGSTNAAAPRGRRPPRRPRCPARAARAVPRADQPHRPGRHRLRLVSAPGETGGWGLTDADDTRRLLQAASAHPRTRCCVTLLGPDGTAVAHGCARGPHPWIPPPASAERNRDGPDQQQAAALAALPARPQRHLHPDRHGYLRPRQPRRPLHPQPETPAPGPRPHRPVHRARLRRPGRALRPRPHPRLPRRDHLPVRPGTRLPPPPPMQASPRLAARRSQNPASCGGPHPPAAATPPGPPSTRPDRS